MPLTPAQRTTVKTEVQADATANGFLVAGDVFSLGQWLNAAHTPDYWVWRTRVTKDELVNKPSADGTTFTWTGLGFIGRAQGERDAWRELFSIDGAVDASQPNVRQAFTDIFSGAAPAATNRVHLATVARRKASRFEKIFAAGAGTTAAPSVMGVEGPIIMDDVSRLSGA